MYFENWVCALEVDELELLPIRLSYSTVPSIFTSEDCMEFKNFIVRQ